MIEDVYVSLSLQPLELLELLAFEDGSDFSATSALRPLAAETAWDLKDAILLNDHDGLGELARQRASRLCADPAMARGRAGFGIAHLRQASSRVARLACTSGAAEREATACTLARGLYKATTDRRQSGLGARILAALCRSVGRPTLPWRLWADAKAAVTELKLRQDPVALCLMAHGLSAGDEPISPPGWATPRPSAPAQYEAALAALRSALVRHGMPSLDVAAVTQHYQRLPGSDGFEAALIVLRGEAAAWVGRDSVYLEICGVADDSQHGSGAAWPALLGATSTMLAGAQAVIDLGPRLGLDEASGL